MDASRFCEFLQHRRSTPAHLLTTPGPDASQRDWLLRVALRVPDHGVRTPWRLLTLEGPAKLEFSNQLAKLAVTRNPKLSATRREKEQQRYHYAPLVLVVIASLDKTDSSIPEQEQILSAGCVAYNLLLAAQALGFGAQWLTGWAAYDPEVANLLGLDRHERVIGFVHIGTPSAVVAERARPDPATKVHAWTP